MRKLFVVLIALAFLTGCPKDKGKKPDPEKMPMYRSL